MYGLAAGDGICKLTRIVECQLQLVGRDLLWRMLDLLLLVASIIIVLVTICVLTPSHQKSLLSIVLLHEGRGRRIESLFLLRLGDLVVVLDLEDVVALLLLKLTVILVDWTTRVDSQLSIGDLLCVLSGLQVDRNV